MKFNNFLDDLRGNSFLSISDLSSEQILLLLDLSVAIKKGDLNIKCPNKVLGLIFDKASTRTKVSFEVAMYRLNGHTINIDPNKSQIGRGESIRDTIRVLSSYVDALAIRTYDQSTIEEYKEWGSIPIINALTDLEHPCQILADFLTIREEFTNFDDIVIAYVGDGNNVVNSLLLCSALLGIKIKIACPAKYLPKQAIIDKSIQINKNFIQPFITNDPREAVKGANVLYTDVWASMGQENSALEKESIFKDFCLNEELVKYADQNHIILHCLPAYRGKEISDGVIESKNSRVFKQAENRLHVQQALLATLLRS